ncbi:RNase H [Popillia japonica]|uniref:ribonuclease H n=1 Tax=Popillia japonica TaxID=7064 RepID=A0AAW1JTC4_POPJA
MEDIEGVIHDELAKNDPGVMQKVQHLIDERYPGSVTFYTDGSVYGNPRRVGYGVFCRQLNVAEAGGLCELHNVYHAELYTILRAIVIGKERRVANMIILTDSQSAIRGVTKKGYSADAHPLVVEIRKIILEYNRAGRIVVLWVPGHCGIPGNEAADNLAVEGARGEVRRRGIYPLDLKSSKRLEVEQGWEQEFRNSEKGVRYKAASSGQLSKPWFSKIKYDGRKFVTSICRLRFHHNHLNSRIKYDGRKFVTSICRLRFHHNHLN